MWMAQAKPERSCSGLKLVRHTESSAADVHQLQDRGLASGDRRQAVVGIRRISSDGGSRAVVGHSFHLTVAMPTNDQIRRANLVREPVFDGSVNG